jgi:glyoxylate/succinic semialdehyde reductase
MVQVGFLGLGIMGEAMAFNILKKGGFDNVVVWNRTPAKVSTYYGVSRALRLFLQQPH